VKPLASDNGALLKTLPLRQGFFMPERPQFVVPRSARSKISDLVYTSFRLF
jgi:hypothetical protein